VKVTSEQSAEGSGLCKLDRLTAVIPSGIEYLRICGLRTCARFYLWVVFMRCMGFLCQWVASCGYILTEAIRVVPQSRLAFVS